MKQHMPLLGILLIIIGGALVAAYPPLPTEFYGNVTYYGSNGSIGAGLSAYVQGNTCGTFTIQNAGHFGLLSCRGNDSETSASEGGVSGDTVIFRYNGLNAYAIGDATYTPGAFKHIELHVPVPFCGDSFCQSGFEDCSNCEDDCGVCTTGNETGGGGGDGGGGTGGGGTAGEGTGGITEGEDLIAVCVESWSCTEWSDCAPEGLQYRTCTDRNACGTVENKPAEVRECDYTPTCFDGIQNGDETGIDCGGSCGPCLTCFDGIQNQGEEGIDCGGPCAPCPTCFDGIQNQGEKGIDCEGPCDKRCPLVREPLLELPTAVCEKKIDLGDPYLLFFLLVVVLAIVIRIVYAERQIAKIKADKKLAELDKAKKWLAVRRRMYLFVITLSLLVIFILLYAYFFFLCPTDFLTYLWILLGALLVSPLIVHRIMTFYEFNEQATLRKLGRIFDAHYQQILQLIDIQNEHLMEIEQRLAQKLYRITSDPSKQEILGKYPDIKRIYRDVVKLYEKYHEHKSPYGIEKDLCERIYALANDAAFKKVGERLPEFKEVYDMLRLLYEQYEEKQKLYDEMEEIEHPEVEEKEEEAPEELKSLDTGKGAEGDSEEPEEKTSSEKPAEESKPAAEKPSEQAAK